jgi:tetratricopeptide (TPR) repeat protein
MIPGAPTGSAAGQVPALLRLAASSLEAGQLAQAEQYCQLILRLTPRHAEALHTLAAVALRVGKPAQALELLGAAMAH